MAWISTDEWEVTGQAALVAWHFYFSSRTRNQFFRNSTLCRWISRSRRFGISWMIFPSRINQSKRMISTKQTLSHHKKLESPQIPMYQPRILHTMPEFGFRNWGKPYNRSVMTTDQRICQIQVTSVDDRAKPRSSNVDVTSLMQGTKTTRSSPLFLLLRFENATRTTQMRWRRKFLPTFCVGGGDTQKEWRPQCPATDTKLISQNRNSASVDTRFTDHPAEPRHYTFAPVSCRNSYRSIRWTRQAMHVWRNMEVRSRNHWCLEKSLSVCVCSLSYPAHKGHAPLILPSVNFMFMAPCILVILVI